MEVRFDKITKEFLKKDPDATMRKCLEHDYTLLVEFKRRMNENTFEAMENMLENVNLESIHFLTLDFHQQKAIAEKEHAKIRELVGQVKHIRTGVDVNSAEDAYQTSINGKGDDDSDPIELD